MTPIQCERAYRKLWDRITRGDGYQPWGYDVPTMRLNHPGFFPARDRLLEEAKQWVNKGRK